VYHTCIFCAADLKENEALERFPVGRSVAFDAQKGRLWAVCPRCARWNLAPIEERWEAVEDAERLFLHARMRAQHGNIGLARLADGTRLVRVGQARPGELALWRYGRKLQARRRLYATAMAVGIGVPTALAGAAFLGSAGGLAGLVLLVRLLPLWSRGRMESRSLLPFTGLQVDAAGLRKARFRFTFDAEVSLALEMRHDQLAPGMGLWSDGILVLDAPYARSLLRRGMVALNIAGAGAEPVGMAMKLISRHGSPETFLRQAAADGARIDDPALEPGVRRTRLLAVEMAVHEALEHAALEGEMAELEAAWREAEEIAGIADALPDEAPAAFDAPHPSY
jgi:hypothetical protein